MKLTTNLLHLNYGLDNGDFNAGREKRCSIKNINSLENINVWPTLCKYF